VLLVLWLRMLMVRARCVRVREWTGSRCLGACPNVRVWVRRTERLTQAVTMLVLWRLLMHLLIWMLLLLRVVRLLLGILLVRRLVLSVRRNVLVDRLYVSLVTHHTQMCTIAGSNARCIRELILELLRCLVYRGRPLRLLLLLAQRR
jgi:hypothetical protein